MKNRGFTLIELLIVLAIIGIAASVAVPAIMMLFKHGSSDTYEGPHSYKAQRVEDHPNLDNCKKLQDDSKVIYSCPDGHLYTM